jgi:glycosyltransferase involved in cell wall biosynthesis
LIDLTIDARLITSSGIGVYIQNIIKNPLLASLNVEVICKTSDIEYCKSLNSTVKLKEFNAEIYSLSEFLITPLQTFKTGIFWSPHYNVPVVNFARLSVVTIHDVFHLAHYNTLTLPQKMYAKLLMGRAVKSDVIFTVSEFSKKEIISHTNCSSKKIKVVYNGIDFKKFNQRFNTQHTEKVLVSHLIKTPYILFVGNIKPHKNLKIALRAFKELINDYPDLNNYTFVIVGKREGFITGDCEIQQLLSDPSYLIKVQFTGWVKDEDLPILYQQAKVFIFPSLYEGFGFPPLEAMAAGSPVISSNAACMPEIYGDAACYFNPLEVKEIKNALIEVLTNQELRSKLIEKGLTRAMNFSWEKTISEKVSYIDEFCDL